MILGKSGPLKMETSPIKIFMNGILNENPTLRLVLGTCPTLAITTSAINGLGMGLATMAVLAASNVVVAMTRNVIPEKVRIPSYITIIAGFVTIVQFLLKAYFPALDKSLGIFIPLIVANCIPLARAEMFASKNSSIYSLIDGVGMGLGFTGALFSIGCLREFVGNGSIFGIPVTSHLIDPALIVILPPGGFFAFGLVIAIVNKLTSAKIEHTGCRGCNLHCGVNSECKGVEA